MRRIGLGAALLVTVVIAAGLFAGWMGWVTMTEALDLVMGVVALSTLWLLVWLPWDLYFAARRVAVDQADSVERGVAISTRDRDTPRRIAPRILTVCLALHVVGAGVIALTTWVSQGRVGYYFAGFYVLAMALRPLGAWYQHLRQRLEMLGRRARYPREDVVSLLSRTAELERLLDALRTDDLEFLRRRVGDLDDSLRAQSDEARRREGRYEAKVVEVLTELERSMAKLTADRELLSGIRAFVRVIKET